MAPTGMAITKLITNSSTGPDVHAATILAAASRPQIGDFVRDICLPDVISINLDDWETEAESQIRKVDMAGWLIVVLLIIAAVLIGDATARRRFASRFPPISDDEFVELCGPGTNREIALRVRRIIADQLGVEYDRIHPSCSFVNDLGCD